MGERSVKDLSPTAAKPRLRGWIHAVSAPLSLSAGVVLVVRAASVIAAVTCSVFTASAVTLFGVSAVYHLGSWSPRVRSVLRRLDHANILLLIAGTYTPIAVLELRGTSRVVILSVCWGCAALGFFFQTRFAGLPRWAYVPGYVGLGWIALFTLPQLWAAAGLGALVLIVTGGLMYTVGGIIYGLRRPDPWPRWFGFHEIFHACTVVAFCCQFAAIATVAARAV